MIDRETSLFLTVSENHTRRKLPEYVQRMSEPFQNCGGTVAAYEGVILGGADHLFGVEELGTWLRRYRYAAYDMALLLPLTHLCLEYAVRTGLAAERPGVAGMAGLAAGDLLRNDPLHYRLGPRGWVRMYWLEQQFPQAANADSRAITRRLDAFGEERLQLFVRETEAAANCRDARALVEQAVVLYKDIFKQYFADSHNLDPLPQGDEFADGNGEGTHLEADRKEIVEAERPKTELKYGRALGREADDILLSDEELASIPAYLERNFGPSFKTERALAEIEDAVCVEAHVDRKLLFTDGQPKSAYDGDTDRAYSLRACRRANRDTLAEHEQSARTGINGIEQAFQNVLTLKSQPETYKADRGTLVNSSLWKLGRVADPQLFERIDRQENPTLVVELLIDASGSQAVRQGMVTLQSYMFSAALSSLRIPHRVMSYCTYGDHTILRRFRDYDDGPAADMRLMDFRASSNNRDGLALAAAGFDLMRRKEENKILIVFSDGLPNDMVSGKKKAGKPVKYVGDAAVKDTCLQVRRLRRRGIQVIGIFLGNDEELKNERMIYGTSFLRLQRAEDFAGVAGKKLSETLMEM